jgi:hypothetical protein
MPTKDQVARMRVGMRTECSAVLVLALLAQLLQLHFAHLICVAHVKLKLLASTSAV